MHIYGKVRRPLYKSYWYGRPCREKKYFSVRKLKLPELTDRLREKDFHLVNLILEIEDESLELIERGLARYALPVSLLQQLQLPPRLIKGLASESAHKMPANKRLVVDNELTNSRRGAGEAA